MARGLGKRLFQIFLSKGGDYSREAINRGTAISKEIRYVRAGTPELLDMSASSKRLFYFAGLFNNLSELCPLRSLLHETGCKSKWRFKTHCKDYLFSFLCDMKSYPVQYERQTAHWELELVVLTHRTSYPSDCGPIKRVGH